MRILLMCLMVLSVVGCAVGQPSPGDQHQNPYTVEPTPIRGVVLADAGQPSWPGTCGYTCNADGFWTNTCTGWVADCATSQQHCDKLPPTCQDSGGPPQEAGCPVTCDPATGALDCTGANLGCPGWAANCAALPMPSWCSNICEVQRDPATPALIEFQCAVGTPFEWQQTASDPQTACDVQPCPSGAICQVVIPGAVLTGTCF